MNRPTTAVTCIVWGNFTKSLRLISSLSSSFRLLLPQAYVLFESNKKAKRAIQHHYALRRELAQGAGQPVGAADSTMELTWALPYWIHGLEFNWTDMRRARAAAANDAAADAYMAARVAAFDALIAAYIHAAAAARAAAVADYAGDDRGHAGGAGGDGALNSQEEEEEEEEEGGGGEEEEGEGGEQQEEEEEEEEEKGDSSNAAHVFYSEDSIEMSQRRPLLL